MAIRIEREYQLKFYLNARRYMIQNGLRGDVHPHTWELCLRIRVGRGEFIAFHTFEETVGGYLTKYQNQLLNDVEPFDEILPTLENITICLARDLCEVIAELGGRLIRVEISKTPTRSYILNLDDEENETTQAVEEQIRSQVVDAVLDELLR
jgi:6-pyruvoyltetrahydropterin/6-carboxytetrahydropterin synthase